MDNQAEISRTDRTERKRLEYNHRERVIALGIVGVIAIGGVIGMALNVQGAQTVVVGVIGAITGWMGAKLPEHLKKDRPHLGAPPKRRPSKKR